jgi:hypothetical protein
VASKSKLKGSSYEAKIKDLFTDHFKIKFERVPLSGAISYLKGDVWCPSKTETWCYTIECKHYAELDFNSLLTAKSNDLWSFWMQAVDEAKTMGKKPLVCFRWNRSKDFVIWNDEIELENQMNIRAFGHNVKIGLLSEFLPKVKFINSGA